MPWTVDDPPNVAKNWSAEAKRKCVAAGNAVLRDGGSDEDAIFACIAAAGKGKEASMGNELDRILTDAALHAVEADGKKGIEWEVVIIGADDKRPESLITVDGNEYIVSLNNRLFDVQGLEESVPMFEGIKVFDNHLTDEEFQAKKGMRSPKNEWLGTIVKPWWDAKKRQVKGIFKVVEDQLAQKLKNAYDRGVLDSVGLSIDYGMKLGREISLEGQRVPVVEGLRYVQSVDLVGNAAAGGGFARLLAAHDVTEGAHQMEKDDVKQMVEEILTDSLPDLVATSVAAALTAREGTDEVEDDEQDVVDEQEAEDEESEEDDEAEAEDEDEDEDEAEDEEESEEDDSNVALEAVRLLESKLMVKDLIAEAKLPVAFARMVESQTSGNRVYKEQEVKAMIKNAREAWKSVDTTGQVKGTGRGISVGMNGKDWAAAEFMRLLMGNSSFRGLEANENDYVKGRVPDAYRSWVKAGRPNGNTRRISEWAYSLLDGNPLADDRAYEAVTTSGMTSIIKNAFNVMLAASYSVREEWWDPIVTTEEVDTIDQATLVRTYGMNTLAVVGEGDPYTELGWADDEETASFVKKGGYVGVTLEMLLSDKVNALRQIPGRLADSWYNTLSAMNSAVFTTNTAAGPVLSDTGALFNSTAATSAGGHANLLTAALTHAAFLAARLAMMKQTAQQLGAGRRLQIRPRWILVPNDLWATAMSIRNSDLVPEADGSTTTGNQTTNILKEQFDVIEVPDWTDADNWALAADKGPFPAIYNIFLRGLRVPELFTADSDVNGAMFTNDTMRYKVRLMTWRYSSTYDCAPVSDFRPLHKSNV